MSTQPPASGSGEPTPEQILSTPPLAADIAPALTPPTRPGRGTSTLTYVLAAIVLLGGGFLGGYLVGHHTSSSPGRFAFGNGGGFPGFGGNGGGFSPGAGIGSGRGFAVGTVTHVDGSTVYVKEANGSTVTVHTTGSTQVRLSKQGTLSDLTPGSTVIVNGPSTGQGELTAASITEGNIAGGPLPFATPAGATGG